MLFLLKQLLVVKPYSICYKCYEHSNVVSDENHC